ncbi:fas-binding factor 1 isoform 2-T2 [Podargus strigoides]
MATKRNKSLRDSVDDILGDLLRYDDEIPVKPGKTSQLAGSSSRGAWGTSFQASKKSFLEDDFSSKLPAKDTKDAEECSASNADQQALLQTLGDMDEMEADFMGIPKPHSRRGETTVKGAGKSESLREAVKTTGKLQAPEKEPPLPQTPLHTVAPVQRRKELTFEDDDDDLLDALGFGNGPKGDEKQGKKAEDKEIRPARSKLDELLGRGSVAKILEQPGMGEHKEFELDKKYQKKPEKGKQWKEEDFVFGAYQPSMASMPKSQSSRQSVRFSAENSSEPKPEPHFKPPPPASQRGSRAGGNWLGLKDEDCMDSEPPSPAKASPAVSYSSPVAARRPRPTTQLPAAEEAAAKPDPLEEENWLSAALSRKKALAQAKAQETNAKPLEVPGEGLDPHSPISQPAASRGAPQQAAALQDKAASSDSSRQAVPWLSTMTQASAHPLEAAKGNSSGDTSAWVPTALIPGKQETQGPAPLTQAESPALGLLHERSLGAPAAQLHKDASSCQAELLKAQARVAELENQVRLLELERTQYKQLLESLQQRHQEDLDLLKNAHRSQLKVMEETYGQQEERLRQEKEQLAAQLLSQSQEAKQAQAELLAQHQQRVLALEQQNTLELERLRELQRVSVEEMRKDHEEQLQRLKRLKDQEIDAVTSATSHTRSLNGVIEQIEKCSSDLHDLSHKVEATHQNTAEELAMEARQWDRQLKVLQDRLSQQQRDMEEERSQLQKLIDKMEARLSEQTQLLEQERWRATAEQSKVESLQNLLEEQRRVMTQQLSMERAELERAKSALLEEQKSVMQKCSEERQKLAAEQAEFRTRQQEQAELKIWSREVKAKEKQLARDRELLEKSWQEVKLENEKLNKAALYIRLQEEEMKSMTKLSSQKYEEGEQALREACRIESGLQTRLMVMQQHFEKMRQQEQHLQQERLSMNHQRRQLEQLCKDLCNSSTKLLTEKQNLSVPMKGLSGTLLPQMAVAPCTQTPVPGFPPPVSVLHWHSLGDSRETLAMASSSEFYAKLLLLKHRAQQDHDFLEGEKFFLETLKKSSYNTSCLSH